RRRPVAADHATGTRGQKVVNVAVTPIDRNTLVVGDLEVVDALTPQLGRQDLQVHHQVIERDARVPVRHAHRLARHKRGFLNDLVLANLVATHEDAAKLGNPVPVVIHPHHDLADFDLLHGEVGRVLDGELVNHDVTGQRVDLEPVRSAGSERIHPVGVIAVRNHVRAGLRGEMHGETYVLHVSASAGGYAHFLWRQTLDTGLLDLARTPDLQVEARHLLNLHGVHRVRHRLRVFVVLDYLDLFAFLVLQEFGHFHLCEAGIAFLLDFLF